MRSVTSLWLEGYAREQPSLVLFEQLPHSSRRAAAERTERAGFTYSPARGVVAAPLLQRMSPGLHGECGLAILPHERRGPENSLPWILPTVFPPNCGQPKKERANLRHRQTIFGTAPLMRKNG